MSLVKNLLINVLVFGLPYSEDLLDIFWWNGWSVLSNIKIKVFNLNFIWQPQPYVQRMLKIIIYLNIRFLIALTSLALKFKLSLKSTTLFSLIKFNFEF
jgi:hypothetical protein